MAASLPRKASPCANDTERQTKNARIDDEVALVPNPTRFFKSFEDLIWFHRRGWDDVLESGEYKLYVIVLFLWAARVAGSDFIETGVHSEKYLPFRLFLWHDYRPLFSNCVTRPFSRPPRPTCPACEILPARLPM